MSEYRVEAIHWGEKQGPQQMEELLNEWADDGWEVVSIVPTRAATSVHALVSPSASADTSEFAVVLRRD